MKNNNENKPKTPEENPAAKTLNDTGKQLAMAFADENTPEAVKDCLRTIIIEAATEATVSMNWDDDAELSKNFPQIIEGLNLDYGRGIYHSLHAILTHDTAAFRDFYDKRMDEKPDKPATETPIMTQEEMEKFITVIGRTELQGDYLFNGFLFFFQSIYEVIKRSPVEAQNLMFHLQQHVFNKLMWESFWAFDAHRKKAHSIFSSTEPFSYDDDGDEENKSEVEEKPETDCLDLSQMSAKDLETDDLDALASQISAVMKNDLMPTRLFNAMADELSEMPEDWRTPEAILENLKALQAKEKIK